MSERFDFSGKVVMVTGVGRAGQIGNAIALAFGHAGAKIVAVDRNATGVAERAKEFTAAGIDATPAAGDLTEPDVARHCVETALKHFGRLDTVVNAAGGLTTYGPIEQATLDGFDREISINLKTTFLVSQSSVKALAATRGSIVNFASVAYYQPAPQMAIYSAAKAGVAAMTQSLALELLPLGVRVNAVAPGMVRTTDNVASAGPAARYVELGQVTDVVLFLASEASGGITGHILPVIGGAA
jgi:NAD(P)-dependent dehydrogenase (short-subunit alcohol dehydrogenase family)